MKKLWCNNYKITPACKWFLEEYSKMEEYEVMVNCCVFLDGKGGEFQPPNSVFVSQDILGKKKQIRILFHELQHYYQFKKGIYDFKPGPYTKDMSKETDKMIIGLQRYLDYLEYPWELDARTVAMAASYHFWNSEVAASLDSYSPTLLR